MQESYVENNKVTKDDSAIDLFHWDHRAICDSCDFPIFGVRFKCIHCEDYGTAVCQATYAI